MTDIGSKLLPLCIFTAVLLSNCTQSKGNAVSGTVQQTAAQLPGILGSPAVMALPAVSAAESATGDMLTTVDSSTDSVIKTASSVRGSAAFREVALAVPKGSLSGSGTLTIAEASNLASPLLAEALGVEQISQAGPAVIIAATSVSIVSPLTIALPLTTSLGLNDGIIQVVAIIPGPDKSQTLKVLASDKIKIADKFIYAEISQFGAYQVVKMSGQPAKTSVPTNLAPVKQPGGGSTTAEIGAALLLASPAGLPSCTEARQGVLYYILSMKQFQACSGGEWVVVDLNGSKGSVGVKGDQGEPGFTGAKGDTGITGNKGSDGAKGDSGPVGPVGPKAPDPVPYFATQSSAYKFVDGKFILTMTETQYANYGGEVLRVCKSDNWQDMITNGWAFKLQNYGDAGCSQNSTSMTYCGFQFVTMNEQCVAPCSNNALAQCTTKVMCEASRMVWDTGSDATPASCKGSCSSSNLAACVSQSVCKESGLMWFANKCELPCANTDLASCNTEARCSGSSMTWSGGKCLGSCYADNPAACITENSCNQNGMSWSTEDLGNCLGLCREGNLKACTTLSSCQQYLSGSVTSFYARPGQWDGNKCVESCDITKMPTATGCAEITFCEPDSQGRPRKWTDNTCADITYQVIEQTQDQTPPVVISGNYFLPVHIKSGAYEVTADTTFYRGVVIDDDTQLTATGSYALTLKKTVRVNGTANHGVTFGVASPSVKWKSLQFYNSHDYSRRVHINSFDLGGNFKAGTKVTYLTINGSEGSAITLAGFFSNITMSETPLSFDAPDIFHKIDNEQGASGLYLANSTLALPRSPRFSDYDPTILFKNVFTSSFQFTGGNGLMWANRWEVGSGDMYSGWDGTNIFNEYDGFNCYGRTFGNTSRSNMTISPGCVQSDNTVGGSVSQKTFAYIHDDYFRAGTSKNSYFYKGMESQTLHITLLNSSGTVVANSVHWVADYVSDETGAVVKIKESDSESFRFTTPVSGVVTLRITSTDSTVDLIGVLINDLNVQY